MIRLPLIKISDVRKVISSPIPAFFLHGLLYILPYLYGLDKYNSISIQQKTAYRKLPHSDTRSFSVCRGEYCICLINKLSLFQIIKINMLHSLIIQSDVVGDTCDVLAVRRSCPSGGYRIAKNLFECLHISSGPGHFNGVPDRAFHFLICGLEMFRDGGI